MSLRINHNISAINAHRNLQSNDKNMDKTLERLSSGLQITKASDGPAKLVISEQMRAQIAGLNQAIDNSETAVSLVQTTEANLGEISTMLTSLRQLAIHAANEGTNDEVMLQADQNEINNILDTINRISKQAQFGKKRLLDGTNGASGFTTGESLEFMGASLGTGDSSQNGFEVRITQAATKSNIEGSVAMTNDMVEAGEELVIMENGRLARYVTNADDTVETAAQNLRNEVERNGLNVNVQLDSQNKLMVSHKFYGSENLFQVSSSSAGVLSKEGGAIETARKGLDIKGTINGESAKGAGQVLTGITGAKCVDGLQIRYTGKSEDFTEIECDVPPLTDEQAAAAAKSQELSERESTAEEQAIGKTVGRVFVSQKALRFQVGANQNQTVGISLQATSAETLGRGIQNKSGFKSLEHIDVRSYQGANDALALVDKAIDEVTATRGELGAFQKNTLESNLANLRVANENLISSESIIRDVDMAAEMANYTKNQIMSQSATAMLAQANQSPANVLTLLG